MSAHLNIDHGLDPHVLEIVMNFFGHVKPYNYKECLLDEKSMGIVAVMPGWNNALNIIWLAVFF